MRAAAFLLLLLFLAACGGHKKTGSAAASSSGESSDTGAALTANFYKCYTGTVAGRPVVVQLTGYDGNVSGTYYYTAVGQNISLIAPGASAAQEPGVVTLQELPEDASGADKLASWRITIHGAQASGQWLSGDGLKQYSIDLKEDYTEGTTALNAFWMADSALLLPGNPQSPKATATFGYLLPREGGEGSFVYNAVKEQAVPTAPHGEDIQSAITASMSGYFADYRREVGPMAQEAGADLESFSFLYTNDDVISVCYNADYWLVTEMMSASYTGGAHGNYGSSFSNIDLVQKRIWHLADIVADTAALRPPLNDAAIARFSLKPGEGMEERLLVDEVPPTDNVCVGPKGLSFVYNPYEIASYADGQITLYLPYKKLLPLLTPAFKERMKLSGAAGSAQIFNHPSPHRYAVRRNASGAPLSHRQIHGAARI